MKTLIISGRGVALERFAREQRLRFRKEGFKATFADDSAVAAPVPDVKDAPEPDVKDAPESDVKDAPESDVKEEPESDVKEEPEPDVKEEPEKSKKGKK